MKVADAMTPRSEVVTAELPGTRDDVLAHFQERSFSSVPVVKPADGGEEFRGLVSRDDLIERPDEDQLALLMREVPTTTKDTSMDDLARLMREETTRRVPVVDGELEGIVTITDVIRAVADGEVDVDATAGSIASRDVNATYEETPLTVVERELFYANVPYAVVLDGTGEMTGIITEVDVIAVAEVVEGEDDTGESLADEDDDYVQLSAKRLAHYVFDVYTAALLLAEAQADLDGYGPTGEADGRTALVARRFVQNYLEDRDARGIGSGDRFPLEHADAVVRYATVEPDALVETAEAD